MWNFPHLDSDVGLMFPVIFLGLQLEFVPTPFLLLCFHTPSQSLQAFGVDPGKARTGRLRMNLKLRRPSRLYLHACRLDQKRGIQCGVSAACNP